LRFLSLRIKFCGGLAVGAAVVKLSCVGEKTGDRMVVFTDDCCCGERSGVVGGRSVK